jgi:hypothetical protein
MGTVGWTAVLLSLALGLIGRFLAAEISVWHEPLWRFLVRLAVMQLPPENRAETEAEWLSIIADIRSPSAQILNALNFILRARRTRNEILDVEWLAVVTPSRTVALTVLDKVLGVGMAITGALGLIAIVLAFLAAALWLTIIWSFLAIVMAALTFIMSTLLSDGPFDIDLFGWSETDPILPVPKKPKDQTTDEKADS